LRRKKKTRTRNWTSLRMKKTSSKMTLMKMTRSCLKRNWMSWMMMNSLN
jgi:hypothetical protein